MQPILMFLERFARLRAKERKNRIKSSIILAIRVNMVASPTGKRLFYLFYVFIYIICFIFLFFCLSVSVSMWLCSCRCTCYPFTVERKEYQSMEHYFQSMKFHPNHLH